jgi:hypothetical protein
MQISAFLYGNINIFIYNYIHFDLTWRSSHIDTEYCKKHTLYSRYIYSVPLIVRRKFRKDLLLRYI